jgi:hypothetical protein
MQMPQIRPGRVQNQPIATRVVAYFSNSALGNSVIQLLTALGIPNDHLGVTPPEQMDDNQGMVLSIACPNEALLPKVESICRSQGAKVERQRPSA